MLKMTSAPVLHIPMYASVGTGGVLQQLQQQGKKIIIIIIISPIIRYKYKVILNK